MTDDERLLDDKRHLGGFEIRTGQIMARTVIFEIVAESIAHRVWHHSVSSLSVAVDKALKQLAVISKRSVLL